MAEYPQLPGYFPFWCRAIYSWGGERKQDLGFVEGDLIECLNAGDGSWWMGRLRRDKRAVGLFPSNFVVVLEQNFIPVSRASSSLVSESQPNPTISKAKPKANGVFRKPFQAYEKTEYLKTIEQAESVSSRPPPIPNPRGQIQSLHNSQRESSRRARRSTSIVPCERAEHDSHGESAYVNATWAPYSVTKYSLADNPEARGGGEGEIFSSRAASPAGLEQKKSRINPFAGYDDGSSIENPPAPPRHFSDECSSKRVSLNSRRRERYEIGHDSDLDASQSSNDRSSTSRAGLRFSIDNASCPVLPQAMDMHMLSLKDEDRYFSTFDQDQSQITYQLHARAQQKPDLPRPGNSPLETARIHPEFDTATGRPKLTDLYQHGSDEILPLGTPPPPPPHRSTVRLSTERSQRRPELESSSQPVSHMAKKSQRLSEQPPNPPSEYPQSTFSLQALSDHSLYGGFSVAGFSATSAGSLARRRSAQQQDFGAPGGIHSNTTLAGLGFSDKIRNITESYGPCEPSNHPSHATNGDAVQTPEQSWSGNIEYTGEHLGVAPNSPIRSRKTGLFRKLVDAAKLTTASARGTLTSARVDGSALGLSPPSGNSVPETPSNFAGSTAEGSTWMHARRDINRSNSLGRNERAERRQRCEMYGKAILYPCDEFLSTLIGDQGEDGSTVPGPPDYSQTNFQFVDKASRLLTSVPSALSAEALARGYLCRQFRSDVQKLRAIFTWVSEKISWEEDFGDEVNTRSVIQTRKGSSREVSILVLELCQAVGLRAEIVRGYLKPSDDIPDGASVIKPNHWWNAVVCDNQWRLLDCSLASPTHPRRGEFSSNLTQAAEFWFFLALPSQLCYTHIPIRNDQQYLVPLMPVRTLLALPGVKPAFFRSHLHLIEYDTSILYLENLEMLQIEVATPQDTELCAEIETSTYVRDLEGDLFDSGEVTSKLALCQPMWNQGRKSFIIKAILPTGESQGLLKVYAGKRGLMHSMKDNPHPLAFSLPMVHQGLNPAFDFVTRHPTPHAQRHDLYISQPQCKHLIRSNTYVFSVVQHAASPCFDLQSLDAENSNTHIERPSSAMSMVSASTAPISTSSSYYSNTSSDSGIGLKKGTGSGTSHRPAKLAIQSPSGKILRLNFKPNDQGGGVGSWENVIKCGELGVWRGLVLADRTARWCVFSEWECL